ncbi:hypothetical protein TNCV_4522761 [Trichonephila clavipes]|nr:hypothetical protein TNCV_4522761 [Trichonephila clavipes]
MMNAIYKVDSDFKQNRWESRIDALKPLSKHEQTSPSRLTRAALDHCPTPMVARCFQPAQSVEIPKHILDCLGLDQWCKTF